MTRAYDPDDISADQVTGIDGDQLGSWPKEYSRDFTLRLLNSIIEQPKERIAYLLLQQKYPRLWQETLKRRHRSRLSSAVH